MLSNESVYSYSDKVVRVLHQFLSDDVVRLKIAGIRMHSNRGQTTITVAYKQYSVLKLAGGYLFQR